GIPGRVTARLVNVLDTAGGRLLRTVTVGHDHTGLSGAVVLDPRSGRVFVTTPRSNSVSVLDARSGRLLRSLSGKIPLQAAVDARSGHVFVANIHAGTLSLLDAASGRLLRTIKVG